MLREQALIVAYAQLAICESEGRDRREVMTLPPMENDPRNREPRSRRARRAVTRRRAIARSRAIAELAQRKGDMVVV